MGVVSLVPNGYKNAIQLDMTAHLYNPDYIRKIMQRVTESGADSVYVSPANNIGGYSKLGLPISKYSKTISVAVRESASEFGLSLVPEVQCLGHVEHIFQYPQCARFRELLNSEYQFCPSSHEGRQFIKSLVTLTAEEYPGAEMLSIGCDEPWFGQMPMCPSCQKQVEQKGIEAVFAKHVNSIIRHVLSLGMMPMIWSDFLIKHPKSLNQIDKRVVILHWNYVHTKTSQWIKDIALLKSRGFRVWVVPAVRSAGDTWFLPDIRKHSQNIVSAVRALKKSKAEGFLNTAWGIRQTPLETVFPLLYAGGQMVQGGTSASLRELLTEYAEKYWGRGVSKFAEFYLNLCHGWQCFVQMGYCRRVGDGQWNTGVTPEEAYAKYFQVMRSTKRIRFAAAKAIEETKRSKKILLEIKPSKPGGRYEKAVWRYCLDMQLLKIQTTLFYMRISEGEDIKNSEITSYQRQITHMQDQAENLMQKQFARRTLKHNLEATFEEENNLIRKYLE
jgi:hypothetical protein